MEFKAHEYQRRAVRFVLEHERCALFLDMGLGKSVITLTALAALREDYFEDWPALVIAPKKVAESTWGAEGAKWDHLAGLSIKVVSGTARQRRAALGEKADVYVIGRDNLVWLAGEYGVKGWPFGTVVVDELTSLKSRGSQRFKAFRLLRPRLRRVIGLTGTPAPNGLPDLWAQMYCIDGGAALGTSYRAFLSKYFHIVEHNHIVIKTIPRAGAQEAIGELLRGCTLTMRAEDYLEMPARRVVDVPVELPAAVMRLYCDFEREQVARWKDTRGEDAKATAANAAAIMGKLLQMASGTVYDDEGTGREVHGEKLAALRELVEAAQSPVLVFYQYRSDVARITGALRGYRVRKYEGDADLRAWNGGEIDVLLAHPASTAYGLNMQAGGHYIVWYGPTWDLELYEQANARLHRQGQRHPVTIYRLLSRGTVDERTAAALDEKKSRQQGLLDGLN